MAKKGGTARKRRILLAAMCLGITAAGAVIPAGAAIPARADDRVPLENDLIPGGRAHGAGYEATIGEIPAEKASGGDLLPDCREMTGKPASGANMEMAGKPASEANMGTAGKPASGADVGTPAKLKKPPVILRNDRTDLINYPFAGGPGNGPAAGSGVILIAAGAGLLWRDRTKHKRRDS